MSFFTKDRQLLISGTLFRMVSPFLLGLAFSFGAPAAQSALMQDFNLDQNGQETALRTPIRGMKKQPAQADKSQSIPKILDSEDEKAYRQLFAHLKKGELSEAEALAGEVKEGVVLGAAQAMFLLHPRNTHVTAKQLAEWLHDYSDLPQAQDVYKKALTLRVAGDEPLAEPVAQVTVNPPRNVMAEAVEWKKPENFVADAAWRAGQFDLVLGALSDVKSDGTITIDNAYPIWIKGLAAFALGDYAMAAHSFVALTNAKLPEANHAAAAFWAGRSFDKVLQKDKAEDYFDMARASPSSFYGMLALAQKNGGEVSPAETVPSFTKHHATLLKEDRAGQRALAFLQIGEKDLAIKELQTVMDKADLRDALIALGNTVDIPSLVALAPVRNGKQAGRTAFPVMPWRPANGFTADPALVSAIAWNESRFETSAVSPRGAKGVMQIMPDTAEHIMAGSSGQLSDPQMNVTLGDRYVSYLSKLNGIDGNLLLIIAGYNCGPGKVQQLHKDAKHGKDPLLFLESMTLKETRDYVQKVLTTYAAYRMRAGKPLVAMAALSRGEWPVFEATRTASR